MEKVYVNELRSLLPGLRRKFLQGTVIYKDQGDELPQMETEHERALKAQGQRLGFGGQRHLPEEHRINVLARDNLGRMPHIASRASSVEVDKLDAA